MRFRIKKIKNTKIYALYRKYRTLGVNVTLAILTVTNFVLRNEVDFAKKEVLTITKQQNELKLEVQQLRLENANLIADIILFKETFEEVPLEVFVKVKRGDKFIMNYLNPHYEKTWLAWKNLNRYSYIGQDDYQIYPKQIADIFHKRDYEIAIKGGSKWFTEFAEDSTGVLKELNVVKWRVIERKDTLVYGMIVPKIK